MRKILVTGSKGQLGSQLNLLSKIYSQFEWIFTDREELDLCNLEQLAKQLNVLNPQIIINCAAHTAVDKAEIEVELADMLNHQSVAVLAKWSHSNMCKLIHISTDYVFEGTAATALNENEPTKPINVYGVTKLAGEKACLQENPDAIIIRTSWVYSSFGANFVKTMSKLMQERDHLNVVADQIGSPTYAGDLAQAIMTIVTHDIWQPGIYNFSNEGEISWYQFALAIQEIGSFDCEINGIPTANYPTPAKRPAFSLLNKSKIKKTFGVSVPEFKVSLEKCMKLLSS
ncbi:dTDP-4-dehydrorhamnose reductase [Flavobacterium xueshanense]|uniref:dTDP-4-dehydrorhamnose reductase n=1 Tax=Flavobacterium xueshanense TaxID=935223 RepID=A0A1I2CIR8_9FLAO|nr:dTDP-4-dehydrorhamnose reductase [Flavobacterium xueshanense]SFE68211.1 dTDP-4-dehydrorhamnose reductase [Flavobacterium xueshanense]